MSKLLGKTAIALTAVLFSGSIALPPAAQAEIVLSELIVKLQTSEKVREDVEIWNQSDERAFVIVEASEIVDAGQSSENRLRQPDPAKLGLLVSPARLILEPGQRKLIRVAVVGSPIDRERVYRVTVKPAIGQIASDTSGLKILIGYDVLVLVRPKQLHPSLAAKRTGDLLTVRNEGNVSIELTDGKQCAAGECTPLPGKRLYSGAEWTVKVRPGTAVNYTVETAGRRALRQF